MQRIEIVVHPGGLGAMREALRKVKVGSFRASNLMVFDPAGAASGSYRGSHYEIAQERVKLELTVPDHEVEPTLVAVREEIDALGMRDVELCVLAVRDSLQQTSVPQKRFLANR
ncbi:MAG TPA: P-II family nitrogen regulator [Myxococcota bacterium]|jgi:nitrogen regulatory protein PII|nr:P-II family nitrogen regulator [Myxococcota bacterium]